MDWGGYKMPDPKLKAEALNNHEFFVVQLLAVIFKIIYVIKVILCQIYIFFHKLTQNMTTDFVTFTKIWTKCFEIQNLQNLCIEFQNYLCKFS